MKTIGKRDFRLRPKQIESVYIGKIKHNTQWIIRNIATTKYPSGLAFQIIRNIIVNLINSLCMMYRALWDRMHEGAIGIRENTGHVAPRALTYRSGSWWEMVVIWFVSLRNRIAVEYLGKFKYQDIIRTRYFKNRICIYIYIHITLYLLWLTNTSSNSRH